MIYHETAEGGDTATPGRDEKERKERKIFKYAHVLTKHSHMHHTVLPANNTMPAFTS